MENLLNHVLVIDDSRIDRFIVEKLIERVYPASVVVQREMARDGLDYLMQCLQDHQPLPGIIFLDINMPEMNGFDFLNEFDQLPETIKNTCRIVMLSSSLNEEDYNRAMGDKNVKMYCRKPLSMGKLDELKAILSAS